MIKDSANFPHCVYWVDHLKTSIEFGNIRFKKLKKGYSPLVIPLELIDEVDANEFYEEETDRLPLFINTQYGIFPKEESLPGFMTNGRMIAYISKSILSGAVACLAIFIMDDDGGRLPQRRYKIADFRNSALNITTTDTIDKN